jgi:ribonucleoside-diphosphate reductase alpha chain
MEPRNEQVLTVQRRDGSIVTFDRRRIENALAAAYLCDADGRPRHAGGNELMPAEREKVQRFTDQVVQALGRRPDAADHPVDIEDIQDQVELALMRYGEHAIARDYVLYRDSRRRDRLACATTTGAPGAADCEACQ